MAEQEKKAPAQNAGNNVTVPRNTDAAPPQRDELLAARKDDPSAKEVWEKAIKEADAADRAVVEGAVKAGPGAVNGPGVGAVNEQGQVHQEGAHVEQPPQPATPPFTDEQIKAMDKSPAGLREPSVAAKSDDTDQTRHPEARVNDPRTPL